MAARATRSTPLYRPKPRFDLLRAPLIGRLLRWRWGRLVFQIGLLLLALLMIYDGFTGPQLAPSNISTVVTWVHYRGLVVLALLLVGNLFCMSCPFTLTRTLAYKWSRYGRRWPRRLRSKWVAVAILFLYLWLYEWLDLWADPLLTVWVIIAYFAASFVLELFFTESPFCKYVCPLGTFNFAGATISPFQITVHDRDVCRDCEGKECVNGSDKVLGCGTELFPPQIKTNMDCVFCLDCARACPYDNVALAARHPLTEVTRPDGWSRRWDFSLLMIVFAFAAVGNAFGMVPPVYELEAALMGLLGTQDEGVALLLIFGVINVLLPIGLTLLAAWLSRALAQREEPLRVTVARYVPALAPPAFAIWFAHYAGFHFLTSALSVIPVFQNFLLDHGVTLLGEPNWSLGPVLPASWLDPVELVVVLVGFGAGMFVVSQRARGASPRPDGMAAQLPWLLLLLALAAAAMVVFYMPMEMRGTAFFS